MLTTYLEKFKIYEIIEFADMINNGAHQLEKVSQCPDISYLACYANLILVIKYTHSRSEKEEFINNTVNNVIKSIDGMKN